MATLNAELPEKLMFLIANRARYKVARGGRGSGKSWGFAIALLLLGMSRRIRIICTREIQNSIKDSVYQLLKDQIDRLGLDYFYRPLDQEIRGKNGTKFIFTGLSDKTTDSIKSFEGADYCWVEEGQTITDRSWKILTPTIRKDDSEIWVSYNPELEDDPTHQRFTIKKPTDCINVEMNWRDNPWFNQTLEKERLDCLRDYPDDYDNIWEGKCKPAVEGAIYFKQVAEAERQGRICKLPPNPMLKTHIVFDLGKGDSLFVCMVQKHMSAIMVIDCVAGTHFAFDTLNTDLRERKYNWGRVWLPHDGFATRIDAPRSSAKIMENLGWDVVPEEKIKQNALSVEEGIRNTRLTFPQIYIDEDHCAPLVTCLKRYRRHIVKATGAATDPVHDEWSHGADCLRYVCCNADEMKNETFKPVRTSGLSYAPLDDGVGI